MHLLSLSAQCNTAGKLQEGWGKKELKTEKV